MQTLQPNRAQRPFPTDEAADATPNAEFASGLWAIEDNHIRFVGPAAGKRPIVLVPTERVLILAVDLPLPTRAKRLAALPFAIEDDLSEPLEAVHCALGAEIAPKRHLAGAVRHDVMRGWIGLLADEGLGRAVLLPDALTLPVPAEGQWSIGRRGDRIVVRTAAETGFAIAADQFDALWVLAERPDCVEATGDVSAAPALDLRQGAYAVTRRRLPTIWRRLAIILAIGVAAHGAIAVVDTLALRHIAGERAQALRTLIESKAPGTKVGDDVALAAADLLPEGGGAGGSGFLPLMTRVSTALAGLPDRPFFQALNYDDARGALTLDVETTDLAGLQRVEDALSKAGLAPASGAANTASGRTQGQIVVTGTGAGQ